MKLSIIYNKYLKYIIWFVILMSISFLVSLNLYDKTKQSYDENKFSELKIKMSQTFKEFDIHCDFVFKNITQEENLRSILLQINSADNTKSEYLRKKLYDEIKNMNISFDELGIFKLYFIRLDKTVFLRYFNPEHFNDSFDNQTLLEKVIQTNSPQSGFAPGANDFSYRRIYSLELQGKTICYIEMVLSEQYFAEVLSYDKSRLTLINYYLKDLKVEKPKNLQNSHFLPGYFTTISSDNFYKYDNTTLVYQIILEKLNNNSKLQSFSSQQRTFRFHFEDFDEMYSLYFIPIYNENKVFCGYLMHGFKNITLENKLFDVIIVNVGLGAFLIIFIFVTAYRKVSIVKLEQKISELQIEKRRSVSLIEQLNKSQDELQEKADFVTKINNLLHDQETLLRKALDEKNRLFSILAHDIKNPITSLYTNAELLTVYFDKMDENEKKEIANRLVQSSKNLDRLVQDLLEWGRLQLGQYVIELKEISLKVEIDRIIEAYSDSAKVKEINFENLIPSTTHITSDTHVVRTIIRNLIQNSIKFTEKGKVFIELFEQSSNNIKIAFRDTGVGIPQEKIQDLFRVDKSFSTRGTRDEEGTGIGLILVNDYIKKIEGTISVESKIGVGTTFFITLPK